MNGTIRVATLFSPMQIVGFPMRRLISISAITGDCWQDELCERCLTNATTAGYVGSIKGLQVCCPFCERSGLYVTHSRCECLHNGPDPKYQPTEAESREVEDFKNGAPSTVAMTSTLMSIMLTCLFRILRF